MKTDLQLQLLDPGVKHLDFVTGPREGLKLGSGRAPPWVGLWQGLGLSWRRRPRGWVRLGPDTLFCPWASCWCR